MPSTLELGPSEAAESGPQPLRVPLLLERLDTLADQRRENWLDVGVAQPGIIDRLACGPNRLMVADFSGPDHERGLPGPLPPGSETGFDMMLVWDWPNYLPLDVLAHLGATLARVAHPGAALHALIHYRSDRMPSEPQRFRLSADGLLASDSANEALRAAPRYSSKALEKAMSDWQVERTLLLNNGMQEFVLRRRARPGQ